MTFRETSETPLLSLRIQAGSQSFHIDDITNDIMAVQTILVLKKHKRTVIFSDEKKGQLVDYLHIILEQQPLRRLFAIFLSDGMTFSNPTVGMLTVSDT